MRTAIIFGLAALCLSPSGRAQSDQRGRFIPPPHRAALVPARPCIQGYVWREAYPGDAVCVDPPRRDAVRSENVLAPGRVQPGGGAYGPDTCRSGYVWRAARDSDHVCVTPDSRDIAARENARAAQLVSACGTPDQCAQAAREKQARVEALRQRLDRRQRDLTKAREEQRQTIERLRAADEAWTRDHPGLGRTSQPSIADTTGPIEQDIRELETALRDAERDATRAASQARR